MDKVKKFLEGYVEWLALALGALFLGWTVYGYVLDKPVVSTVGSENAVEPSDVNKKVWDGSGQTLDSQIKNSSPPPEMMPKVNYPEAIVSSLGFVPEGVNGKLATPWTPLAPPIDTEIQNTPDGASSAPKVAALPVAPAPIGPMFSHGHSNVQPLAVAAGAPVVPGAALDKNWITFESSIPVAPLARNFADAKIPPQLSNVTIYRVEVVRQVRDASGAWVDDTEIPPLEINPLIPLPAQNCTPNDRQNYKTWAETPANVILLAEPPFYTVLQGDVWYEPGMANPNDRGTQMVNDPFDPQNPLAFKGDPNTLLPDEKAIYDAAKAKAANLEARKNRSSQQATTPQPGLPGAPGSPSSSGRGGRSGRSNGIAEPQPQNPGNLLMPPPPVGGQPAPPMPGGGRPPGMDGPQGNPQTPGTSSLPQGSFNPADRVTAAAAAGTSPDVKIWVHDASVQAGKTYRYKMKYIIANPVAGTSNTCKNPADAQLAYIESSWGQWSEPISVESDTNFYAIDNKHGIRFDIFRWKLGNWQMQSVNASAGDRIGSMDPGTHTDFDTGWTLVDIRDDPAGNNENKVLVLVSDTGTVIERQISTDRLKQDYRDLLVKVMQNRTASAGGTGQPGATPPLR